MVMTMMTVTNLMLLAFRRASKALTRQSKILKRAFYDQQIEEAETAAQKGDQRTLHMIVRRLAPRSHKAVSRLQDPHGRLLGAPAEMQAIMQYGQSTFASLPDITSLLQPSQPLHITPEKLQQELSALKLRKAVPQHIAPAAVWRQCSHCLGDCLAQALTQHFSLPAQRPLQADWRDCYIRWLPKPNKKPVSVDALRPIGLQCPSTKALACTLKQRLLDILLPAMASLPQFAYIKQRGTMDALLRVHMHFSTVTAMLKENVVDRFQKKLGKKAARCLGAMSLSLDLSKAFDGVDRAEVYRTMGEYRVPTEVINAVQQLHLHTQYKYHVGQNHHGATCTTNGVKQGCKIAPYLWCFLTLKFMGILKQHRDETWLQAALTIFADDVWSSWILKSTADFLKAKRDIELILSILEDLCLTINFKKTAILLVLEGCEAAKVLREHTTTRAGQQLLCLRVRGRDCTLPIKTSHEYLGSIVSYLGRQNLNLDHRVQAGNGRYQALRRTLNGRHVLTAHNRVRLWRACVQTSQHYSLAAVGITRKGLDRLTKAATRQLRAALKQPAHVSHLTNQQIWQQAGISPPIQQLVKTLTDFLTRRRARATASPEITTAPLVLQYAEELLIQLQSLAKISSEIPDQPVEASLRDVSCPVCGEKFASLNGMRIHCQLAHHRLPEHPKCPTIFDAAAHSVGGLPECKLCHRRFFRYQQLVKHINTGACEKLGGESFIRKPLEQEEAAVLQMVTATACAIENPDTASPPPECELPLVRRPTFRAQVHRWASWPLQPGARADLLERCVLCYMWLASSKHIKQHMNTVHREELGDIPQKALNLCKAFKSQLTRGRSCVFCKSTVGAPGRHSTQCTALYQASMAALYVQAYFPEHGRGQPGGGDLPSLFSQRSSAHIGAREPRGSSGLDEVRTAAAPQTPATGSSTTTSPGPSARHLPSPASVPGSVPQPTGETAATDCGNEQAALAARGQNQQLESGSGHGALSQRGCPEHPPLHDADGQRVERQEGTGRPTPHLSASYCLAGEHDQRAAAAHADDLGNPGRPSLFTEGQMDDGRRRLVLPPMVSKDKNPDSERGQAPSHPCGSRAGAELPLLQPEGRHHLDIQKHAKTAASRGSEPPGSHLPPRDFSSGCQSSGSVRVLRGSHQQLAHGPHRHEPQEGKHGSQTDGGSPGTDGLRTLGIVSSGTAAGKLSLEAPLSRRLPRPALTQPPCFRLHNPHNLCYLNSSVYSFWAAVTYTGHIHLLPQALRGPTGGTFDLRRLMGFRLLGWRHPERQHDVRDLIAHLHPQLASSVIKGAVSTRQLTDTGVQCSTDEPLTHCIMLSAPPLHNPDLQALVNCWHQQDVRYGITEATAWLHMQLPRYLNIPVFTNPSGMEIEWVPYRIVAYIQHHGLTPRTGHYTTILAMGEQHWLMDDEKPPCQLAPDSYEHACHNMYILVLANSRMRCSSSPTSHTARVPIIQHEAGVPSESLSDRHRLADRSDTPSGIRTPENLH